MPRRPNTRPTNIYWLFDMRSETLAVYPLGRPFYCGKTIQEIQYRLTAHKNNPKGGVATMLTTCGENVRTQLMEIVPVGCNWVERERAWIRTLRDLNPDCVNVANGGEGAPGNVRSEASKRLMSEKMKGRKFSPETIAKMSARMKGNPIRKGKKLAQNRPFALRGRPLSDSHKAALRAAWTRRKAVNPQHRC